MFFLLILLNIFFIFSPKSLSWASLVAQTVKDPPAMQETQARSLTREDPLGYPSKEQLPTPVFLLGESYGQRSLVGYSPWDHKESGMIEAT